jgi:hypothetical protein
MFAVSAVDFFGLDLQAYISAPGPGTAGDLSLHPSFSTPYFLSGPFIHVILQLTFFGVSIALLLIPAWGVHRRRRWAAILGLCVSLILGLYLLLASLALVTLIVLMLTGRFGSHDAIGVSLRNLCWAITTALLLLLAATRLWKVQRELKTTARL